MHRFLLILLFLPAIALNAGIDFYYKEVIERGYTMQGDSVIFPDGSKCLISDFNAGKCGKEWMTEDYCITDGGYVWDENKCCEGLVAFIPKGSDQAVCRKKSKSYKYWIYILTSLIFLSGSFFLIVRSKAKKHMRRR